MLCPPRLLLGFVAALLLIPGAALAQVTLPAGTKVYGELDQTVTSKKKHTAIGDVVEAHVWRDVRVEGGVVIEAGAPIAVHVSTLSPPKIGGKGALELSAVSVRAVDGSLVLLDGGYDRSGPAHLEQSPSILALLKRPLALIRGRHVVLEPGTVFDASVHDDIGVSVDRGRHRDRSRNGQGLEVEVLYSALDPGHREEQLPVRVSWCGGAVERAWVVSINEKEIPPIAADLQLRAEEPCPVAVGALDLKALGKHFRAGINRFEVEAEGARSEVVLEIEL